MALDLSKNAEYDGLGSIAALAIEVFKQTGLKILADSRFDIDSRVKLTPGNSVKALLLIEFYIQPKRRNFLPEFMTL